MTLFEKIHFNAIRAARQFKRSQSELIEAIQQVDAKKVFRKVGHGTLFDYCRVELKLSESNSYVFIQVARKAIEIPELKRAIDAGEITVSQAKRIAPVITPHNKDVWLKRAATLSQRELEKEVVKVNPRLSFQPGIRPISENRSEFRAGMNPHVEENVRLLMDLFSQKMKAPCDYDELLAQMTEIAMNEIDPITKARRIEAKKKTLTHKVTKLDLDLESKSHKTPPFNRSHRSQERQKSTHAGCY